MRFLSLVISALAILTAAPHPVRAQPADGSPCGTMANTRGLLNSFTRYFVEDEYALMRDPSIQQLPPTAPRTVVADIAVCRAVLDAALLKYRTNASGWIEVEARGFDHVVLQYGPYYAILISPHQPRWFQLMVFRAPDLEMLQVWQV